ncbi:hypothetical protein ZHAS_00017684 [Anopheles sinensis]|uniref:Uncharacterized protein n=1 Tax=Anopheles sinensis TaxID=74873 RepID=A0A084WGY9_ANOSI|nr:hypothetical protein ZHAS_00017684 [Anopheles sinensis]
MRTKNDDNRIPSAIGGRLLLPFHSHRRTRGRRNMTTDTDTGRACRSAFEISLSSIRRKYQPGCHSSRNVLPGCSRPLRILIDRLPKAGGQGDSGGDRDGQEANAALANAGFGRDFAFLERDLVM